MVQPVLIRHNSTRLASSVCRRLPNAAGDGVQTTVAPQPGTAHIRSRCSSAQRSRQLISRWSGRHQWLAVMFEPDFAGGITGQVAAFGLRQQRTQMQCRSALSHVEVHHHGGVLPVWRQAASASQPASIRRMNASAVLCNGAADLSARAVIAFPLSEKRITMRGQRGVELRRVMMAKSDPVATAALVAGRAERELRLGGRSRRSRFELDRGAQLSDRGTRRQLRVMLIRARTCPRRDHPDLICLQSARPHALAQRVNSCSRLAMVVIVRAFAGEQPVFQATNACTERAPVAPSQLVTIDLCHDLHDAPINRIALTVNSANSANSTSTRAQVLTTPAPADAVEDMTTSSQPPPTSFCHPIPV